jgi:hypothetical protein
VNNNNIIIVGIIILIITALLGGCTQYVSNIFERKVFDVSEGDIINVYNNDIRGEIRIKGQNRDNLTVTVLKETFSRSVNLDDIIIDLNKMDKNVNIETKFSGDKTDIMVDYCNISIPRYINLGDVFTSNGDIGIRNINGNINAKTSNGQIFFTNVSGDIFATALSNESTIPRIHPTDPEGYVGFINFSGSMNITCSDSVFGRFPSSPIENTTIRSNADTTIELSPDLDVDIEVKTLNGNITISDLEISMNESSDNFLKGKIGIGGISIYIITTNGNIQLKRI